MDPQTSIQEKHPTYAVIIPAFNEEASVDKLVRQVHDAGFSDVLVINDGSEDATTAVASRAGAQVLTLPFNLGIGGAVQTGLKFVLEAEYDYILRLDGDGQHPVEDAQRLLQPLMNDEADIVIGSRFFPGKQTYKPPLSRALGIRWFAVMITLLTGQKAYDTTSGMVAMNRRALLALAKDFPQDYPEVEGRILMYKAHLRVLEVPVAMQPRTAGVSSITFLRSIYYIVKVTLATFIISLRKSSAKRAGGR